jgi:uncharacterized integral membrane protein
MLAFIFTIIFSVATAYFATQNTSTLTLHLASYSWTGIPVYLLMLGSLLVGLLFAWVFQLLNTISSSLTIKNKEHALKEEKKANLDLTKRIHQLELENSKITSKEEDKDILDDNSL